MSTLTLPRRTRWWAAAAAAAVVAAGGLAAARAAQADSGLPPLTAAELIAAAAHPSADSVSGTISLTTDLGLPDLPTTGSRGTDATSMLTGTHTIRMWSDGRTKVRVATLGQAAESDLVRNGTDVWLWSSAASTATHYVLPAPTEHPLSTADGASGTPTGLPSDLASKLPSGLATDLPSTPQELADRVLAAADSTTSVTATGVETVAGRAAYVLTVAPKQSGSLVEKVTVALDGQTFVPLQVRVYSTELADPAVDLGFTSVDFATPDAGLFDFTPPTGATVTTRDLSDASADRSSAATHDGESGADTAAKPTVTGTGWSRVVVATLPADAVTALSGAGEAGSTGSTSTGSASGSGTDLSSLLALVPTTSGSWGSGRVLAGTLFTVVLTDDGRVAAGAVPPQTLYAALAS